MTTDWIRLAWMIVAPLVSGILGGLGGAFLMGFKFGSWREKVEGSVNLVAARVETVETTISRVERRLERGDDLLASLPALKSEMHTLIDEMKETRKALSLFVTRRECDLKSGKGACS